MKTYEQLQDEAAERELDKAEHDYRDAQIRLTDLAKNGTGAEFAQQWALTEGIRNNLNWLRSVRK